MVADIDVTDAARYDEYRRLSGAAVAKYGGRFLVRGGKAHPLEGDWMPPRFVVIEFPTIDAARRWYDSPEYRKARQARDGAARFRSFLVDVSPPS
jgi:uncharacterized protein (DUF1330 family)